MELIESLICRNRFLMNSPLPEKSAKLNEVLSQLCTDTDALGAIFWDVSQPPFHEIGNCFQSGPFQIGLSAEDHLNLLQSVSEKNEVRIAVPQNSPAPSSSDTGKVDSRDEASSSNPPALVLIPILAGDEKQILEVFFPSSLPSEALGERIPSIHRFLSNVFNEESTSQFGLNPNKVSSNDPLNPAGQNSPPAWVSSFCTQIHQSIHSRETAFQIANEMQQVLQCDRVSVVRFSGNKAKLVAISGQQSVNKRSNTVQLLERLAKRVLPLKEEFRYPRVDEEYAPQIESALNDYLKISVARSLDILPLLVPKKPETDAELQRAPDPELIGGVILENFTQEEDGEVDLATAQLATAHATAAYNNSLQHEKLLFYPLWRMLGRSRIITKARNLPISISIAVGILILGLVLALVPAEFKVVCDGELLPQKMEYIYAPHNADVQWVVPPGTMLPREDVPAGEEYLIAKLENNELLEQIRDVEGNLESLSEQLKTLNRRILDGGNDGSVGNGQLLSQIQSKKKQLQLLQEQLAALNVKSSIDGRVMTFNTEERLLGRPVNRGDLLLEVGNTDGEWIVELKMPDNRIGHLLNAQKSKGEDLKVTCVLSTDPGKSFQGKVMAVSQSTEVDQEKGQTVLVKVKIDDQSELALLRTRAQVVGKIHCGRRSLGYVWFHQIGEFMQKNVWFRIW